MVTEAQQRYRDRTFAELRPHASYPRPDEPHLYGSEWLLYRRDGVERARCVEYRRDGAPVVTFDCELAIPC